MADTKFSTPASGGKKVLAFLDADHALADELQTSSDEVFADLGAKFLPADVHQRRPQDFCLTVALPTTKGLHYGGLVIADDLCWSDTG